MRKELLISAIGLFLLAQSANAVTINTGSYYTTDDEGSMTMENLWSRNGKYEQKIIDVGSKLLKDNKIDKRVMFQVGRDKVINANSTPFTKLVTIHAGIFPYIDNDDELAYIMGHEISHSLDAYGGIPVWTAEKFNTKHYENKADLMAIDFMVNAGYNPVAALTCANKIFAEEQWDALSSHPKGSKRLIAMYKYIKVKYPWALNSQMTTNIQYVNFTRAMDRNIKEFNQKQDLKTIKQKAKENEIQRL